LDDKARIAAIKQRMDMLNNLLHEFSPPEGEIPTSFNYVQIVDCSVALYNMMQQHTVCPRGAVAGSGPFCAPYHMQEDPRSQGDEQAEESNGEQGMIEAADDTSPDSPAARNRRSNMYFFLQNTMQEFPFAWWYKCILLQSRKISSKDDSMHCDTWIENSIDNTSMVERFGLYSENDVRSTLKQINGGITSVVLSEGVQILAYTLADALQNFTTLGFRSEAEMQQRDADLARSGSSMDAERRMLRIGAPREYNMKCYSKSFLPKTVSDILSMGEKSGVDCVTNMLMWIHNEGANFSRFDA
jgi:hypothetical protein